MPKVCKIVKKGEQTAKISSQICEFRRMFVDLQQKVLIFMKFTYDSHI